MSEVLETNHHLGAEVMTGESEKIWEGEPTSARNNFLIDWGLETVKQSLPRLADSLQRVLTLATALIGGSFYAKDEVVAPHFRAVAMLLFTAAAAAALVGSFALSENVATHDTGAIERFKLRVMTHRERWLRYSSIALGLGLLVAVVGALLKAFM